MEIGIYKDASGDYVAKPVLDKSFIPPQIKYFLKWDAKFYYKGKISENPGLLGLSLGSSLRLNGIRDCTIFRGFTKSSKDISVENLEEIVEKMNLGFSRKDILKVNVEKLEVRGIDR